MQDLRTRVNALKRPKLLVSAAKFGLDTYKRNRDLKLILAVDTLPKIGATMHLLLETERDLERQRQEQSAHYSYLRHIEVLTAVIAEATLFDHGN